MPGDSCWPHRCITRTQQSHWLFFIFHHHAPHFRKGERSWRCSFRPMWKINVERATHHTVDTTVLIFYFISRNQFCLNLLFFFNFFVAMIAPIKGYILCLVLSQGASKIIVVLMSIHDNNMLEGVCWLAQISRGMQPGGVLHATGCIRTPSAGVLPLLETKKYKYILSQGHLGCSPWSGLPD
jgi:hypothetical protein